MVFQDPQGSLDPRMTVRSIIAEGLPDKRNVPARVEEVLNAVGLLPEHADRYPHEFSGGQRQRISIARAIIGRPEILLADEAVSALDVSVRSQILDLLNSLVADLDLTLLFISHDLAVVRKLCTHVAVMHEGEIVEQGPIESIWENPQHSYTQALLLAIKLECTSRRNEPSSRCSSECSKTAKASSRQAISAAYDPSEREFMSDKPTFTSRF